MVCYGLYVNWDKISGNDDNASAANTLENSEYDQENIWPVMSLDKFDCWFMDTMVETSGALTNLTRNNYNGVSVEVALMNSNGESIRSIRMQTSPPQIAANKKINFKAMAVIGNLSPTQCRITNILVSGKEDFEYVPFEANCEGCETI